MLSPSIFKNDIFSTSSINFNEKCIELFHFQAQHCSVYSSFLRALNVRTEHITEVNKIPFLPISFFKTQKVTCVPITDQTKVFESSGTSGVITSKHYCDDISYYLKNTEKTFEYFYGSLIQYEVFALLPSYIERGTSSLTAMANHFIKKSNSSLGGFHLSDFDTLFGNIQTALKTNKKVLLIGVTFALLDFCERFTGSNLSEVLIMETGGMKGRREEMTRTEVHDRISCALNVSNIHSEYGMTELMSQSYSKKGGLFETAPWMKIMIRELNDPLSTSYTNKTGALNIIDLANVSTCSFIATQDLGRKVDGSSYEILGRIDNSEIRGCNLLVAE